MVEATATVVTVAADKLQGVRAQEAAKWLEQGLLSRGVALLAAEDARARFAANHSQAPVELSSKALDRLRAQVQEATRLLARNRLREALESTKELRELSAPEQDYLRRELSRAQELFDVCVVTASQIAHGGDKLQASRHMLRCAQTFPGLTPVPEYHPPEVRALYNSVLEDVEQAKPAIVLVRSTTREACTTRVNGIDWGQAPAQVTTAPAVVRVQLECGDSTGRIHVQQLHAGFNQIVIDPLFDRVARSAAPRMGLRYTSASQLAARRRMDAMTLGRALQVQGLLVVQGGEQLTVHLLDSTGAVRFTRTLDGHGPAQLGKVIDELATGPLASARGPGLEKSHQMLALAPEVGSQWPPGPGSAGGSAVSRMYPEEGRYTPELPILSPQEDLAWISPLMIGLGYAVSLAGGVFALNERHIVRRDWNGGVFDLEHYNDTGSVGLGLVAGGAMLSTGAELLTLPEAEGVPFAAWMVGGVGVLAAVVGLGFTLAENSCNAADERSSCVGVERDKLLGPLLLIQSVPLWTVPITYMLSDSTDVRMQARPGFARFMLRRRF